MNKDGLPFCFPEFIFLLLKQIFILLLMPANRNALIRYKTIDNCLRNPYRRWTLEDLVDACSDALYEYEGIDKGISKRTAQMDIQMMRSEKLGYNAPIVVYENKYYKYEDPEYSITQTPLNEQDLKMMSEAVEVLRQFKGFSYFTEMSEIINRLEDHVASARMKTTPVIDFEKNESLKGLDYLDTIYHAIVNEHPIQLKYILRSEYVLRRPGRCHQKLRKRSGESWLQSSGSRSTLHHNQAYTSQSTTGGKAT